MIHYLSNIIFCTGLYSLTHLVLDNNLIKSMVSAAFRHIPQLEKLSLRHNLIEGNLSYNLTSIIIHLYYIDTVWHLINHIFII